MLPEEIFKRRHRGTPESFSLIIVNAIAIALIGPGFIKCHNVSWVFWVIFSGLVIYNFFTVRRNRESFERIATISYIISSVVLLAVIAMLWLKDC